MGKKGICSLIFISEGRLKSPPIDGFSWSISIVGDFNRPSDATTMSISELLNSFGVVATIHLLSIRI